MLVLVQQGCCEGALCHVVLISEGDPPRELCFADHLFESTSWVIMVLYNSKHAVDFVGTHAHYQCFKCVDIISRGIPPLASCFHTPT